MAGLTPATIMMILRSFIYEVCIERGNQKAIDINNTIVYCNSKVAVVFTRQPSFTNYQNVDGNVAVIRKVVTDWNMYRIALCYSLCDTPDDINDNMTIYTNIDDVMIVDDYDFALELMAYTSNLVISTKRKTSMLCNTTCFY